MADGVLGKKIGMTQIFRESGEAMSVTVVKTDSCVVSQLKTEKRDGYNACQLAFKEKKEIHSNRAETGHFKKAGLAPFGFVREIKPDNADNYKLGQKIVLDQLFKEGDRVKVSGRSIGKGFAGVIKRHGFSGGPAGHGSHFHRAPGSIGMCAWPAKTEKGKKLPGQMGNKKHTVMNLEIVRIDSEKGLLLLKGAVPGAKGGFLVIEQC
ncbi:MAG: 50S ribosomal protein L3 [bacterium]